MKSLNLTLISLCIILVSCSDESEIESKRSPFEKYSRIIEIITYQDSTVQYINEFKFDQFGKVEALVQFSPVYSEDTTWVFPKYDEKGRLIEFGTTLYNWKDDTVLVTHPETGYTFKQVYANSKLIMDNNLSYEYEGRNVKSKSKDKSLISEYLEYDDSLIHPYYYLKSIEPYLAHNRRLAISKNIFKERKDQPRVYDDFTSPLMSFDNNFQIDNEGNIKSIKGEWTIYVNHYQYFE